jgi:hypothetical protein
MDGPIVHDRGLSPLFLNARMFSGRSMQQCPHYSVRSLHELVKNLVGLTNLIILDIALSTKKMSLTYTALTKQTHA